MSTKTKEVRRFALFISAISAISLVLTGCSAQSGQITDIQPKTSQFVLNSFQDGEFLTPFEPGKPEIGLTLEAITSLSALGASGETLEPAINWVRANTNLLTSPGLIASFIFTANAAGFGDDPSVAPKLFDLKKSIEDDGSVSETNNFSYAWVILALLAADEDALANQVALKLISNSEDSGAYKYVKGDSQSVESADVTGFALMAIKATSGLGSSAEESKKDSAVESASTWLQENLIDGTHYDAYGNNDLSGTAYGTMALLSIDVDVSKQVEWLTSKISSIDGGIPSPYSGEASDVFTTVQSLLPLSNASFLNVLENINSQK